MNNIMISDGYGLAHALHHIIKKERGYKMKTKILQNLLKELLLLAEHSPEYKRGIQWAVNAVATTRPLIDLEVTNEQSNSPTQYRAEGSNHYVLQSKL